MKLLRKEKGFWVAVCSLIFLYAVFGKTFPEVIERIPSPEFDNVRSLYLWILVGGCGYLLFLAVMLWRKKEKTKWLYPLSLLVLGAMYLMVLPPFSAPDEARHFISAYRLSSQLMGQQVTADEDYYAGASAGQQERIDEGANVLVRKQDDNVLPYAGVGRDAYAFALGGYQAGEESAEEKGGADGIGSPASVSPGVSVREEVPIKTTPAVFVPQALGITFARLLQMDYVSLLHMGRIFNLLAFAGMCVLAVRIMPFKKELLMAVSLLPMTLHLAASYSYDASVIGLSLLFLAYCLHLAFEKQTIRTRDVVLLALLLLLLGPCKIVYLPLAGICLMIPSAKFRSRKEYALSVLAVLALLMLAVFLINHVAMVSYATDTENYISWDQGSAGFTMQYVIHQPYETFRIYYETLVTQFDYYQATMLGAYLGNLDPSLNVPYFCLFLLWGVLFVSSVKQEGETVHLKGGHKLWMAVLVCLCVFLTLFSMLLGWTPTNSTVILGIQGRYFLPALPLVLLLLFDDRLVIGRDYTRGAFYTECFVSVYALIRICSIAVIR